MSLIRITRLRGRMGFIALCLISTIMVSSSAANESLTTPRSYTNDAFLSLIYEQVRDDYEHFGLASYYNNVSFFAIKEDQVERLAENLSYPLADYDWLAAVGRFNVLLVQTDQLVVKISDGQLSLETIDRRPIYQPRLKLVRKDELGSVSASLDQLRYQHLWTPLAWLSKLIETSLVAIHDHLVANWGIALIVLSILLKIVLTPLHIYTIKVQQKVASINEILLPRLKEIKERFDGEEAHKRIMQEHSKLGVSPFFTLKPMLVSLIQIPILIAVFNALGEMPQLSGQSFLWIADLAYPDAVGHLPVSVPLFGDTVSLMPFIMAIVTFVSAHLASEQRSFRLHLITILFFVLFYPFPASMLVYWTMVNILQASHQIFHRKRYG